MHAVAAGTLGPWMPRLKEGAGLDAGGLGLALSGCAIGLVAGTRLADPLVRRWGGRSVVRIAVILLACGLAVIPLSGGLAALSGTFAGFGLVSGVLDVSMNLEAVAVETRFERRVMSGMHGTWSVSLLVGAAIALASIAASIRITLAFPLVAGLLVAASFVALRWLPAPRSRAARQVGDRSAPRDRRATMRIVLICVTGFASFLTEGVAADWGAVYLRDVTHAADEIAGLGVVAFSAGMATSRFLGDRVASRVGASRIIRTGASAAAVAIGAALLVGGAWPATGAFLVLGLGIGPVVPLSISAAGAFELRRASAVSAVVTAGYVGSIVGPIVVGSVADRAGLRASFALLVISCVAIALAGAIGVAGTARSRPARRGSGDRP